MFHTPAMTWTLTAVLLAGGTYQLWQAYRSAHLTDRINNTLHALMNTLMAAMLWNLAPSTLLAQIGLLAGAALWFTIQAVARPEYKLLCAGTQGRLKCAYHALTMAGAALMIATMTHPATPTPTAGAGGPTDHRAAMAMPMPAAHHTTAHTITAPDTTAITALGNTPALLLTLTFTAAAITFLTLLLPRRATTHRTRRNHTRAEHAIEALAATTMALMFATMTA